MQLRRPHGSRRSWVALRLGALAALVLLWGLPARGVTPPAAASARAAAGWGFSSAGCAADPSGDVRRASDGAAVADRLEADALQRCAGYKETLTLALRVADPTDPATGRRASASSDPAVNPWEGLTFASWGIEVDDDGATDYLATLRRGADGELVGEVADVRGAEPAVVCDASDGVAGRFVDGRYVVQGVPVDCVGGQFESLAVDGSFTLDPDGSGGGDDVVLDRVPDEGAGFPPRLPAGVAAQSRRLSGPDRFATAVAISARQFAAGSANVYLAEAALFADAVAGGTLTDGPILLVGSSGPVPQVVLDEIARLGAGTVTALGGRRAIADEVLAEAAGGRTQRRIFGPDRIATSVEIARTVFGASGADRVFLARADLFADAVAAGVLTAGPVVLVPRDGRLPDVVAQLVEDLDPDEVTALGGAAAVSDGVLAAAASAGGASRTASRLAGANRLETAVAISAFQFAGAEPTSLYLARADVFADAVAGGALTDGPILLVPSCGALPLVVRLEIAARNPDNAFALGGTAAICQPLLDEAAAV